MASHRPAEVLYIHPAKQGVGFPYERQAADVPYVLFPVGVIGLMNLLRREGIAVRGLNEPLERLLDLSFDLGAWLKEQAPPCLILIDLHWYEHAYGALEVARLCKRIFPQVPIALGGLTASGFAQEILYAFHEIDLIVRGDAEEPLRCLVRALCLEGKSLGDVPLAEIPNLSYRREWEVCHNPLTYVASAQDLDALDFVDVSFLEHARYYRGLQYAGDPRPYVLAEGPPKLGHWLSIGRGCTYDCAFCGGGAACQARLAGRARLVARSTSRVVSDLEALAAQGVHQAALSLDPCLFGQAYWEALFAQMRARGVRIGLYNECFTLPPAGFVRAFGRTADLAHSQLALSVLSGEAVRHLNGKPFSDVQLWRALSLLKAERIPIAVYFSLNLPGETERTFAQALDLAERIGRFYPSSLLQMFGQPHTVDPFSPMSLHPERYGLEVRLRTFMDYYAYCRRTAVHDPTLGVEEKHGFRSLDRASGEADRILASWRAFAQSQPFHCE
ncbi:MAG: cobalamin B12-binding domain-containing protein [Chloroflexi bacterium]|nr:cobalamin B12-binding domain-containing protein [Chloroflexota bacterium]